MPPIDLVRVPENLATSYAPGGRTRDAMGKPWSYGRLMLVGACKPDHWRVAPWVAQSLLRLEMAMRAAGSSGMRLTDVLRRPEEQAKLRAMYDRWISAGRPPQGSRDFDTATMKTAFAARPYESNHQWGGALDFDVEALDFPGLEPEQQLPRFWQLARPLGFRPIIAAPHVHQSESWHFDCYGPLQRVFDGFEDANLAGVSSYAQTALAGCVLAGLYKGSLPNERLVQARLLAAGFFCGPVDGIVGPRTLEALWKAGVAEARRSTPAATLLSRLDGLGVAAVVVEHV